MELKELKEKVLNVIKGEEEGMLIAYLFVKTNAPSLEEMKKVIEELVNEGEIKFIPPNLPMRLAIKELFRPITEDELSIYSWVIPIDSYKLRNNLKGKKSR